MVRYYGPDGHTVDDYDPADPHRMLLASDGTAPIFWLFAVIGVLAMTVGSAILIAVIAG